MAWTNEYAASLQKSVDRLDGETRRRIHRFLDERIGKSDNPRSYGKASSGPLGGFWCYRVGDYRVIFDIQDKRLVVLVVTIDHRREVYR